MVQAEAFISGQYCQGVKCPLPRGVGGSKEKSFPQDCKWLRVVACLHLCLVWLLLDRVGSGRIPWASLVWRDSGSHILGCPRAGQKEMAHKTPGPLYHHWGGRVVPWRMKESGFCMDGVQVRFILRRIKGYESLSQCGRVIKPKGRVCHQWI